MTRASAALLSKITACADAFAWPLKTSHYLQLVNPLWTTHRLQARVEKVRDETRDARTLTLRPGLGWRRHRPGQHVCLGVPIGGKQHTRTYSISSPPERDDGCITVTVKAIAGGRVSRHLVRSLPVGTYLPLGLPQGDFHLPDAQVVKPLFITAGSGITPVMSMLRSLVARERLPDSVHIHYAPQVGDVIFGQELRELAQRYPRYRPALLYTREWRGGLRHFSPTELERLCPDWRERECYACGPQSLLDELELCWRDNGLGRRLHTERFRAPLAETPAHVQGGLVRFARSGKTAFCDGRLSLLRVAENAGLNPPHGCRMGICHGCDTPLLSGRVRDLRSNKIIDAGQNVQTCVCAAAGDCKLEL